MPARVLVGFSQRRQGPRRLVALSTFPEPCRDGLQGPAGWVRWDEPVRVPVVNAAGLPGG